jgi:hypothetical protein
MPIAADSGHWIVKYRHRGHGPAFKTHHICARSISGDWIGPVDEKRQRESIIQVYAIYRGVLRCGPGEDSGIYVETAVRFLILHCGNKYLYIPSADAVT